MITGESAGAADDTVARHDEGNRVLADGSAEELTVSRRDGAVFKAARRADWGDAFDPESGDASDDDDA